MEVDFMNTEITKERLTEWFYPTENFRRYTDNVLVDYAEIEINPDVSYHKSNYNYFKEIKSKLSNKTN